MKRGLFIVLILAIATFGFVAAEVDVLSLIGKSVKSKDAKKVMKASGERGIYKSSECYYYIFNEKGFDFLISNSDTIQTVFLYADGADDHKQYGGTVPYGLQMTHDRATVEKLLGVPKDCGGEGVIGYYCSWDEKGIGITYQSVDTVDMSNKIHHISFSKPIRK